MKEQKFIAAYSMGKDSTLAIYKAVQAGLRPIALLNSNNTDWPVRLHNIDPAVIERLSACLDIPISVFRTTDAAYAADFKRQLQKYRELGAELCVFGDIDLAEHRDWNEQICQECGIKQHLPLWGINRRQIVEDFLASGFSAQIITVDTDKMSADYLGQKLCPALIAELAAQGIDACGENGEFHTLVTDGPLFTRPLQYKFGRLFNQSHYAVLPVL